MLVFEAGHDRLHPVRETARLALLTLTRTPLSLCESDTDERWSVTALPSQRLCRSRFCYLKTTRCLSTMPADPTSRYGSRSRQVCHRCARESNQPTPLVVRTCFAVIACCVVRRRQGKGIFLFKTIAQIKHLQPSAGEWRRMGGGWPGRLGAAVCACGIPTPLSTPGREQTSPSSWSPMSCRDTFTTRFLSAARSLTCEFTCW